MIASSGKWARLGEAPAYTIAEAAHLVHLPAATLRSWVAGRSYSTAEGSKAFSPLITLASSKPVLLSFANLVEVHVIWALRNRHSVSVKALRDALSYGQRELGVDRLLLSPELRTEAGQVLLDRYGELVELNRSGQLAMRQVLEAHLRRVEWDEARFPVRLYPFLVSAESGDKKPIVIDPSIAFGRPVTVEKYISTAMITQRIDNGESIDAIAEDYDLSRAAVEQAALYERAA